MSGSQPAGGRRAASPRAPPADAPVVNADDRHRRVEAVICERQRFGARSHDLCCALGALVDHLLGGLDRHDPSSRRLVGAGTGADVEDAFRIAERSFDPRRYPWIGLANLAVALAYPVIDRDAATISPPRGARPSSQHAACGRLTFCSPAARPPSRAPIRRLAGVGCRSRPRASPRSGSPSRVSRVPRRCGLAYALGAARTRSRCPRDRRSGGIEIIGAFAEAQTPRSPTAQQAMPAVGVSSGHADLHAKSAGPAHHRAALARALRRGCVRATRACVGRRVSLCCPGTWDAARHR